MVLEVRSVDRVFVVSHERIAGLMDAMTMPFDVRDAGDLAPLAPGAIVDFTLVLADQGAYATSIRVRRYAPTEQDPQIARRLALLRRAAGTAVTPLAVGQVVPDFVLVDHAGQPFRLASLAGKVVALNFVYTRCALPQFCLRIANNFGVLQKRFRNELGRDLELVTVTFDPERDTPEVLATYAAQWQADGKVWRFLTGPVRDVRRVCGLFGVEAFADEGLMDHSLHTVVIGRDGRLVANIEGNQYTSEQLGDLVHATITAPPARGASLRGDRSPANQPPPRAQRSSGTNVLAAFGDSLKLLALEHGIRVAFQEKTRRELGGPFWGDYRQSVRIPHQWEDSDAWWVNYIGHPIHGAAAGYAWIDHGPETSREIDLSGAYWAGRARALAWSAGYSLQFEFGPLSEASIGNVGLRRETTGWVDHAVTPAGAFGLIVAEDALDRYFVKWVERRTRNRFFRATLRLAFNPARTMSNTARGQAPWHRAGRPLGWTK
jgi:protein SCO1/2